MKLAGLNLRQGGKKVNLTSKRNNFITYECLLFNTSRFGCSLYYKLYGRMVFPATGSCRTELVVNPSCAGRADSANPCLDAVPYALLPDGFALYSFRNGDDVHVSMGGCLCTGGHQGPYGDGDVPGDPVAWNPLCLEGGGAAVAVNLVARFAARAKVPVFCLPGHGGRQACRELRLDSRIRLVNSPRHAAILLLAGTMPSELKPAIRHMHDQLPEPRGVLLWNSDSGASAFERSTIIESQGGYPPADAIVALFRNLLWERQPSTPLFGPPQNPVSWQGKGDYGQGGKGMMMGKPYGRRMGMTDEDIRDGLQLGSTMVSLGPFLPWMPPGLRFMVTLQGDVIQQLKCKAPDMPGPDLDEVFLRALTEPVPIAAIEIARARHHLSSVADLLFLLELGDYGRQALRVMEETAPGRAQPVRQLERSLKRIGFYYFSGSGAGRLPEDAVAGLGLVSRTAGLAEDARLDDPSYRTLGFTVVTGKRADAGALCRQRMAEAAQAVELAGRAGEMLREPGPPLEGPRGIVRREKTFVWQDLLEKQAVGMAWDAFVTLLVSLDIDASVLPPAENYGEDDQPEMDEMEHDHGGNGSEGGGHDEH